MAVTTDCTMLRDFWYLAVPASAVSKGKTRAVTLLGEEILLGRTPANAVFAYSDACPHRGMPMRHGTFDGTHLRCCYHGWAFAAANGHCTHIPALIPEDETDPTRFRLRSYPCREVQGNIWVFMPARRNPPDPLPDVPTVPGFDSKEPQVTTTMRFPSNADIAAMGFCDPAHPAFVHTSRWWKSKSALSLRPKSKSFEPVEYGFRMKQHQLKEGANPYRLLGTDVRVDVTVTLPGLRIEHIRGTKHSACVLAAVTPNFCDRDRCPLLRLLDNSVARACQTCCSLDGARFSPAGLGYGRKIGPWTVYTSYVVRRGSGQTSRLAVKVETRIYCQPGRETGFCESHQRTDAQLA